MTTINIAAVGDILMWRPQINAARANGGSYSFDKMFKEVMPELKNADLTIGNLETTLSGPEFPHFRINPKTKYPMFNCPDELASTLKRVGFDILTTANNHCMDCGITGLNRTLDILDKHSLMHTGTYRTANEARKDLIVNVKGIKIGILSYTYGTNFIPVPEDRKWAVNSIYYPKLNKDIKRLKNKSDLVIVCLHFGREFYRYPSDKQKKTVEKTLEYGADIILGCHPHVLQPIVFHKQKNKLVIYSLGNFISQKMLNNKHSERALILKIQVKKDDNNNVTVADYSYLPTWVQERAVNGKKVYRVLPVKRFLDKPDTFISKTDSESLKQAWKSITSHIKGKAR
ncbi:CapA family protein [Desulfuribacillus alkaliarsenatis]|uniref:Capsule synthesis protein CapA domain-containing protein n=1 Tax=Desulfuribacillus alkaliarsenatis TaxID=766136 RepID=A0A1E5G1D1_9FIRM|nr:CapA family protein [Desulfuribacillus alkaliarsenatis]OEF96673.1 hypothetical protein BHF68_06230 [Desulfuribacillus alkaliarsenatis]